MPPELQQLTKKEIANKYLQSRKQFEESQFENLRLKEQIDWYKRQVFGAKSERYIPTNSDQLQLDLGDVSGTGQIESPQTEKITYTRRKPEGQKEIPVRTALPAHLRREINIVLPEGDLTGMVEIKEIITEQLQEKPGEIWVVQTVRKVFGYKNQPDKGVVTPELPAGVLPKFSVCVGMMALVMIRKYVDHLPIYRQIEIYKRAGLLLSDSTLGGWISAGANMLIPLYELQKKLIFGCNYLQADDTGIRVLDPNKPGTTHRGFYWIYHDPVRGLVWFEYRPARNASGPKERLKNFKGRLQTDGHNVYDPFEDNIDIILMGCWAHARRYFEKALTNDYARADYAMKEIQKLYAIERFADVAMLSNEERKQHRQDHAAPIIKAFKEWLIKNLQELDCKSSLIVKAINYTLPRIEKLSVYLQDGMLRIDNNLAENAIRPIALGRKNYLFAGSHHAAEQAAMIYSFMASCKKNNIDPWKWLSDVLSRINEHSINKLEELLPHKWKPLQSTNHVNK